MYLNFCIIFIIIFCFISFSSTKDINLNTTVNYRKGKFFGKNVNFQHFEGCTTASNFRGSCMRRLECLKNGGFPSGFCGTYGVCCELNLACNGVSKLKRTLIRNPLQLPTKCTYHFQPFSTSVCQLKIDFDMVLAQPSIIDETQNYQTVSCVNDVFQVGDIKICGTNINQHIYVPFDVSNGTTDLSLTFIISNKNQNPITKTTWNMIVTQLECPTLPKTTESGLGFLHQYKLKDIKTFFHPPLYDIEKLAPIGCLQYFTEKEGSFESFNYNGGKGPYMGNLRYGICFRRTGTDLGVQFSAVAFEIGAYSTANQYLDEDCHSAVKVMGRSDDYLLVAESVLDLGTDQRYGTRYCGNSLENSELYHAPPGPFVIYFNSDNIYGTTIPEKGFRIQYSIQ